MVGKLIKAGAPLDEAESTRNLTPLHIAAEKGPVETVEMLLTNGASPHSLTSDKVGSFIDV